MKKRILALLLCATTAVSLVGCGGKEGEAADATETVEDTQTAEQLPAVVRPERGGLRDTV